MGSKVLIVAPTRICTYSDAMMEEGTCGNCGERFESMSDWDAHYRYPDVPMTEDFARFLRDSR